MSALATSPLLWLAVTLLVFEAADTLSRRSNRHPLLHPVLWAAPVLMAILLVSGTPYPTYAAATWMLGFLLGPATVALAVPLWRARAIVRKAAWPLAAALLAGSVTAAASAVGIVWAFGAPDTLLASAAPRATTTPVAMALSQQLGGIPSLTAAIVLMSGIFGAMIVTPLFNAMRIRDFRARGFAAGVSAHGFGTARAFQVDALGGTFAGVGMAMNAATTALLLTLWAVLV
ncbi:MAG: LrgB family protein [Pseudomonadota bacterium]